MTSVNPNQPGTQPSATAKLLGAVRNMVDVGQGTTPKPVHPPTLREQGGALLETAKRFLSKKRSLINLV